MKHALTFTDRICLFKLNVCKIRITETRESQLPASGYLWWHKCQFFEETAGEGLDETPDTLVVLLFLEEGPVKHITLVQQINACCQQWPERRTHRKMSLTTKKMEQCCAQALGLKHTQT